MNEYSTLCPTCGGLPVDSHAFAELGRTVELRDQEIALLKGEVLRLQGVLEQRNRDVVRLRGQKGEARRNARYLACKFQILQEETTLRAEHEPDPYVMHQVLDTYPAVVYSGAYLDGSPVPTDEDYERMGKTK